MDFSQYGGPSKEWLAVEATLPPVPPGLSVLEKRDVSNAFREASSRQAMAALADRIELIDVAIPARDGFALEGRLYWPRALPRDKDKAKDARRPALYLHLHGGGYLFGTLASEDSLCAQVALRTTQSQSISPDTDGVVVLNLNYRHTPEHVYPTAWHDVQDALVWIHAVGVPQFGLDPARVVVGGISAGAHLTASLVLEQHLGRLDGLAGLAENKKLPPIAGQVLMIPALVNVECYAPQTAKLARPAVSSLVENKDAPLLSMATMRFFTDLLMRDVPAGHALDARDTKLNPGNATVDEAAGLPPTVFGICGLDPLRDEGLLYAHLLTDAGVPVDAHLFKGVPHGFRRYGDRLSVSKDWDEVMEGGILWALSSPAASPELTIHVHGEE